jgi:toxin ParE1/3/4
MPQVLKRPQAETDLDDIWWHIAQDNPDAADRLLDTIDERCKTLAQFPYIGTSRDELLPDLRSLPVGNYLIFTCRTLTALRSSGCWPVCGTLTPSLSHASKHGIKYGKVSRVAVSDGVISIPRGKGVFGRW